MKLSRYCLVLTLCCSVTACAADPLDLLHKDASVVVRIKAPETTIKDVAAFVDQIQPGTGAIVQGQAQGLGMILNNPTLAGVDMKRDWYIMVFAFGQNVAHPVLIIPATDADEFKNALGSHFSVAVHDDYVIYSTESSVLETVKAGFDSASDSMSAVQSESLMKDFQQGHISILLNSPSLQETFASELENAEAELDRAIEQIALEIQNTGLDFPTQAITGFYSTLGRVFIQGARDSTGAVIRIEANDVELRIDKRFTFQEGSATQKRLAIHPIRSLKQLNQLPPDMQWYIAGSFDVKDSLELSRKLATSIAKDEDAKKRMEQGFEATLAAKLGAFAGGFDMSSSRDAALRYLGSIEASPTEPLRDALEAFGAEGEYNFGGITQEISYKRNAETIAGKEVDLYTLRQTIPPEMDPMGIQKAMTDRMYGGDTITQRLVFESDQVHQMMGGDPQDMSLLIEGKPSTDETMLNARKRLYPEANLVNLIDIPRMVLGAASVYAENPLFPLPISSEQLSELIVDRTYLGSCVSLDQGEMNARVNLPISMFQELAQSFFLIQTMAN